MLKWAFMSLQLLHVYAEEAQAKMFLTLHVPPAASGVYSLTPMVKRIVHAFMTAAEQQWTLWRRYVLTWKLAGRTTGPH